MTPNDVKELLDTLIEEHKLPINASNRGPQLVSDNAFRETQEAMKKVIKQWMNGCGKSHSISVGRTAPIMEDAINCLALETHRTPEIRDILKSLIAERTLPLNVIDRGYTLKIIANEGIVYHDEDMTLLESLVKNEGLNVSVRHNGFSLRNKEDGDELSFSDAELLAKLLSDSLIGHGLQVKLIHQGFDLNKNQDDEIDIAEAKELTYRLEIMVGIRYVQGGYSYSDDVPNPKIHWKSAQVNTALPII